MLPLHMFLNISADERLIINKMTEFCIDFDPWIINENKGKN